MLSQRFAFFLNLVMHRYECGKYNINYYLKETFIWGNLRCSANGGKNIQGKKVYWKLKIILGQLLSMNVDFHSSSHIMHLKFS